MYCLRSPLPPRLFAFHCFLVFQCSLAELAHDTSELIGYCQYWHFANAEKMSTASTLCLKFVPNALRPSDNSAIFVQRLPMYFWHLVHVFDDFCETALAHSHLRIARGSRETIFSALKAIYEKTLEHCSLHELETARIQLTWSI